MAIPKNKNKIGIGNNGQLYPGIQEDPRTRLSLIVKAYSIMCIQLLLIFGMCLVMTLTHPVRDFMRTSAGSHLRFAITAITFISLILMIMFRKRLLRHPYNYVLFFLCTLSISFMLGSVSSPNNDGIALQATGLILLLMIGLTLFTFVAKRDLDFSWLLPFWFCVTLLLLASDVVETIFPEIVNHVFYRILVLMFWISIYFHRLNHFVHSLEID